MLWMFITTFGIAAGLSAALRRRIELCFAPAVFSIILVLYLFALAGPLVAGCWAVVALCALGAAWAVFSLARWRGKTARLLITPGAAGFAVMMAIAWYAHRGQLFGHSDEFTHWGLVIKAMFTTRCLPHGLPENLLYYSDYPPATALFSTCWMLLTGAYSEGLALTSANVLLMACFMPLMQHTEWKRWKEAAVMGIVCMMVPMVFQGGVYQNICVDVPLGAVTAYALMIHFTTPRDWRSQGMICIAIGMLPLIKASGTFMALLALMVMGGDLLLVNRQEPFLRRLSPLVAPALCLLAAKGSWSAVVKAHDIAPVWQYGQLTLSNLAGWVTGNTPSYRKTAVLNFCLHLTNPKMMGDGGHLFHLSYVMWLVVLALVIYWLKSRETMDGSLCRAVRAGWLLGAGSVCYALGLLVIYVFVFPAWEAASLISFERYMSSYMTVLVGVMLALAVEHLRNHPLKAIPASLTALVCLLLVVNPAGLVTLTGSAPRQWEISQMKREGTMSVNVSMALSAQDKVAYISQERGYQFYINHYEMYPTELEMAGGSMVIVADEEEMQAWRQKDPNVLHVAQYTPQEWAELLRQQGFTHVYLHDVNDQFIRDYSSLFDDPSQIADDTLFRIDDDGASGVRLIRIV